MNNSVKGTLLFIAGAAIGSAATWHVLKTAYERIANDEIESVRESYRRKMEETKQDNSEDNVDEKPSTITAEEADEYVGVKRKAGYTDYCGYSRPTNIEKGKVPEKMKPEDLPYVIPPEEFGDLDDYAQVSLTYFKDGVLADEGTADIVDDVDATVGESSLSTFGMYESDSVFVRNDRLKSDYEILADERTYDEYVNERPFLNRDNK